MPKTKKQKKEMIELRIVIKPEDKLYPYVSSIKEALQTDNKAELTRFLIKQAMKSPIEINIPPVILDSPKKNSNNIEVPVK